MQQCEETYEHLHNPMNAIRLVTVFQSSIVGKIIASINVLEQWTGC